ncbi:MAG TPA: VWA domain-containing protein [Bryobacteraceae bacterium]|nr:VWA domain-containing protein [Bryobacteraceae bacterium]
MGLSVKARFIGRVAAGFAIALALLPAQPPPDDRLLNFSIVAVNDRGEPVNDLTRADFQVRDAGKRQPIVMFRHDDAKLQRPAPPGPNEFSNRRQGDSSRVTVVLFDLMNERFATSGITANQIVHDLKNIEGSDDLYLYLLTLEGRLFAVRGLAGVGSRSGPGEAPWTRQLKSLLDSGLRAVLRTRPADVDVAVRVQLTFNALDTIAAQLSAFPGRKNVVWVTDGVPIALGPNRSDTGTFVDFTPQLRHLSEAFDRAGAAIYPVQQIMLGSPDAMGGGTGIGSRATLDELAGLTGGRPTGSKDVGAAVRQAMNDARGSYRIGYYAPPGNWDSKFHKLRITCSRKGVKLQSRSGYYAWPEPPGTRAENAVDTALGAALDAGEIGLGGSLTADRPDPGQKQRLFHLSLRIDTNDVGLAENGDTYNGQLRLAVISFNEDGRVAHSDIAPLDLHYTAAQRDAALKEGISIAQNLTLASGVNKLRLIVFDRNSNTVGSLTIPVRVAAPGQ